MKLISKKTHIIVNNSKIFSSAALFSRKSSLEIHEISWDHVKEQLSDPRCKNYAIATKKLCSTSESTLESVNLFLTRRAELCSNKSDIFNGTYNTIKR